MCCHISASSRSFSAHLLFRSTRFFVPQAKNVFGCARSHVYTAYGIYRYTSDVQPVGCISDSNISVLLNRSINSFITVRRSWSGRATRAVINEACSVTLEHFRPFVHLPLRNTGSFLLRYYSNPLYSRGLPSQGMPWIWKPRIARFGTHSKKGFAFQRVKFKKKLA
jgi:hypothetical protein